MEDTLILTKASILKQVVNQVFDERIPQIAEQSNQKPFLTKEEVMELTGWSSRKLQYMRSSKQLSYVKHGRSIVYPTDEFYQFMEQHHIKPLQ